MNVKSFYLFIAILFVMQTGWMIAQPYPTSRSAPRGEDLHQLIRQLKTHFSDLKHELHNHEVEIRTFEEKLHNQEISSDQLRHQLMNDVQSQKDFVRASNVNFEGKIETLDQSVKNLEHLFRGLTADLRQMKTQANDSIVVLGNYKQKMSEFEKLFETQNQHIQNLEVALNSMMEVLQTRVAINESVSKESERGKYYKVQAGDTLEKIAKGQKISVQTLREANQLTNDRIFVGQMLKIP